MQIPWHDPIRDQKELPVSQAPLPIRAGVVGRVGLLLLSCGTRRMACAQLHERDRRGARSCVRRRHRAAVHRVHLLRRREHIRPDADADGHRRQHRQARPARALCQAFSARRRVHDGGRPAHPARRDRAGRRAAIPRCSRGWPRRSPAADSRSCSAAGRSRCCWPFWARASGSMCARG